MKITGTFIAFATVIVFMSSIPAESAFADTQIGIHIGGVRFGYGHQKDSYGGTYGHNLGHHDHGSGHKERYFKRKHYYWDGLARSRRGYGNHTPNYGHKIKPQHYSHGYGNQYYANRRRHNHYGHGYGVSKHNYGRHNFGHGKGRIGVKRRH